MSVRIRVISGRHPGLTAGLPNPVLRCRACRTAPHWQDAASRPRPVHPRPGPDTGVSARDPTDANTFLPGRRFSHQQEGKTAVNFIQGIRLSRIRIMLIAVVLAVAGLLVSVSQIAPARAAAAHAAGGGGPKPTIVLEHGAWADGSSWDGVIGLLQAEGYTVYARPAARPGERLRHPGRLPQHNPRPGHPGRALLRRDGHHQRRHR